jgi:hypothetical protein
MSDTSEQQSEMGCKKSRKKSRTLRFNKWTGYAGAAVSGLMSIGDVFGYMRLDWTCIVLLVAVVGISGYNYYLRLHTTEPVE